MSNIIRVDHAKDYTCIANSAIRDKRLSLKARGLHHLLLSYPDNWRVSIAHLSNEASETDKRTAIQGAVKELEELGYLTREQVRGEKGHLAGWEYVVRESPSAGFPPTGKTADGENRRRGKPQSDNPTTGNPTTEDRPIINTDLEEVSSNQVSIPPLPPSKEKETPGAIEKTDSLGAPDLVQQNAAEMDIDPDSDSRKILAVRDNSTSHPKHNRQGDKYFGQVRQENYQRSLAARLQRITVPIEEREPWGNAEVFKAFEAYLLEQAKKWEKCQNPASYVASKLQKIASGDAAKTEFDDWYSRYLASKQPTTSVQIDTPSLTSEQEAWVAIAKEIQMVSEAAHITVTFHRELWQVTSNFGDMNGTLGAVMERVPLVKLPVRFKAWYSECYRRALQNAPHLRLPAPLQPQKRAG